MALLHQDSSLLHRSLVHQPHRVISASGHHLFLSDSKVILDACGGAAVAILGHGNEEVISATLTQMRRVSYVHTLVYTTDCAEDLAKCVLGFHAGESPPYQHGLIKAFFVGSGSEANDAAMKCARQYWFEKGETKRRNFISRRQAYHGNTIGAMSVSSVLGRKMHYEHILLPNVSYVSPADSYHGKGDRETEEEFLARLVAEIEHEILRLGPETIVSFMQVHQNKFINSRQANNSI